MTESQKYESTLCCFIFCINCYVFYVERDYIGTRQMMMAGRKINTKMIDNMIHINGYRYRETGRQTDR